MSIGGCLIETSIIFSFVKHSIAALSDQINELIEQGYSRGLVKALAENAYNFDFRFWIIDNSGSMQIGDGHRIVPSGEFVYIYIFMSLFLGNLKTSNLIYQI